MLSFPAHKKIFEIEKKQILPTIIIKSPKSPSLVIKSQKS